MAEYSTNPNKCYVSISKSDLVYVLCFNVLLIFLPTIGLVIFYFMIIHKVKRRDISFGNISNSNQFVSRRILSENLLDNGQYSELKPLNPTINRTVCTLPKKYGSLSKKRKFTTIISMVSVIFYCCQLPSRLFLCWSYFNDTIEISQSSTNFNLFDILSHIVILIYFLHCVSNPIIYNFLSSEFQLYFQNFHHPSYLIELMEKNNIFLR
jgi:hypothetical protein